MRVSRSWLAIAAALCCCGAGGASIASATALDVKTPMGAVHGVSQGGATAFLGVPYAQPPVGNLRWRAPVPLAPWQGVKDASKLPSSCYQQVLPPLEPFTHEFMASPPPSEDCLYLNVWAPAHAVRGAPVLVWVHGGGFLGGSGGVPVHNGAKLAARGVVVVTLNYRLGPFGFLAHPGLSQEAPDGVSGNYGLLDVIAALRWVKQNIASFGGDADDVTVAGQSAGAQVVDDLMVSPAAHGLFVKAIAESGAGIGLRPRPLKEAEQIGLGLADKLGAHDVAALRRAPADAVLKALPIIQPPHAGGGLNFTFVPVLGGATLPVDPDDPTARIASPTPVITGFNADEVVRPGTAATPEGFERLVRARYGAMADRFLAVYPHATAAEASSSQAMLSRDRYMASLLLWAQARSSRTPQPVFAYLFDHSAPTVDGKTWGAFHTAEVPYVFGTLSTADRPYTAADQAIARQMSGYWLAFLRTGNPNSAGAPTWPKVRPDADTVMELGDHPGERPAVSSPDRLAAFRAFVKSGGTLSMF